MDDDAIADVKLFDDGPEDVKIEILSMGLGTILENISNSGKAALSVKAFCRLLACDVGAKRLNIAALGCATSSRKKLQEAMTVQLAGKFFKTTDPSILYTIGAELFKSVKNLDMKNMDVESGTDVHNGWHLQSAFDLMAMTALGLCAPHAAEGGKKLSSIPRSVRSVCVDVVAHQQLMSPRVRSHLRASHTASIIKESWEKMTELSKESHLQSMALQESLNSEMKKLVDDGVEFATTTEDKYVELYNCVIDLMDYTQVIKAFGKNSSRVLTPWKTMMK